MSSTHPTAKGRKQQRSALGALLSAIVRHLPDRDTQEIGEVLRYLNDVFSDFGPSEILRGLVRRVPLPQCHHREHWHTVRPASLLRPSNPGQVQVIHMLSTDEREAAQTQMEVLRMEWRTKRMSPKSSLLETLPSWELSRGDPSVRQ